MSIAPDILLTPGEAGDILRLPTRKVIRLARTRVLPSVELPDGELRFEAAALTEWIGQRRCTAEVPA